MKAPIVMVHGAFCGGWAYDGFRKPFEAAGHRVLCPDLRGHDPKTGSPAGVSMSAYARDIADLCKGLDVPPILIGHSMGGLVAQMAARLVPTKAVVLLAPSPPWGVSGSSFEEAVTAFGVQMAGAFWGQGVSADPTLMRTYSLDRMPRAERDATIKRLVPESGRALTETLNWWIDPFMTTGVGSGGLGSPTLVMVGQKDMVHPPATAHLIAERLGASFIEMPGMSHWLLGEEGWEDVADRAMGWMSDLQT